MPFGGARLLWPKQTTLFPLASELQGALADGFAEGLVRRERIEPCGLRAAWARRKSHAPLATPEFTAARTLRRSWSI